MAKTEHVTYTYQAITTNGKGLENNSHTPIDQELELALRKLNKVIDKLSRAEYGEIFLDALTRYLQDVDEGGDRTLVTGQAGILLEAWFEHGRPNWQDMCQDLTETRNLCLVLLGKS